MAQLSIDPDHAYEYELGHGDWELERLARQAALIDPMTRRYFLSAGLVPGMRVLDIGSGAGHAAFLAAELVGDAGEVIGTDVSPTAISAAQAGARTRGLRNVAFRLGDPAELSFDRPFDAIVGRYILMFSRDPAAMLKGIARHLRPGGVIVFHEVDWTGAGSFPPAPTFDSCFHAIVETFRRTGTDPHMGLHFPAAFAGAGLPAPTMGLQALTGHGADPLSGLDLIAELAITMLPVMEQMGVTTTAELSPATLFQRMRDEVIANRSVVIGRSEMGAWARLPDEGRARSSE